MNRYGFVFDWSRGQLIVLYENNVFVKRYTSQIDTWSNISKKINEFLDMNCHLYHYTLTDFRDLGDLDLYHLQDKPIHKLKKHEFLKVG